MQDIINRISRRVMGMASWGRKTSGSDSGNCQTHQTRMNNNEIRDNTPRLAEFGFSSNPPVGSDQLIIFLGGDRNNGVIVGTGHQQSRPKGLSEGETKIYSQDGKYIYLTASNGITIDANHQQVTVNNASTVTVNASSDVTVNCGGNMTANVTGNSSVVATGTASITSAVSASITAPSINAYATSIGGHCNFSISGSCSMNVTGNCAITSPLITLN
jgi:phage baseplate assembly protein V